MRKWERGRITGLANRSSWAILPIVHVGRLQRESRGGGVLVTVGWLCFTATVRVN